MGMADDAVEVLYDLVQPGVSDQIRLNAAKEILNRSGLNEAIKVEVEHSTVSQAEEIHKKLAVMRDRFLASQAKDEEELEDQGEILDEPEKEE
jgi:ABC-type ATPase with predicted acetyltransferase domain